MTVENINASKSDSVFLRWLRFNAAGILGVGVQLLALAALTRYAALTYLVATPIAVEIAIVHNFVWHERYTWAARTQTSKQSAWKRFIQFNLTNGGVSLIGNLVLMRFLVGDAHLPVLAANLFAIAVCSGANFLLAEYFVFLDPQRSTAGNSG